MNENGSTDDLVTDRIGNHSANKSNHVEISSKVSDTYAEISSVPSPSIMTTHRHDSKCFITEVFMYGIKFILRRRIHHESPGLFDVKRFTSSSSTEETSLDEGVYSIQVSMGSDRSAQPPSGTSSIGFHDQELSNIDDIIASISLNLRNQLCDSCYGLPQLSVAFYKSLENVLTYFQDRYHSCQWLSSNASQLTESELNEAKHELCKVYDAMFGERINWGRIVAMIGFVGELSVCALSADRLELIEEYVAASVCYVQEHMIAWITDHGGWEGLVDFQAGQNNDTVDLDNMFGNLGRLAGVAALALAGVVICKFVADHI